MLVFPNCKINLGLLVKEKRADGFHNIETAFFPVPLKEAVEITSLETPVPGREVVFGSSGTTITGEESDNLCIRAWHILKKDFPRLPSVKIYLHKVIPIGAGLGGGSADAAFTLMALNEKYALYLSVSQLLSYALQLGSDCPFFILNKPCIATSRGEILEQIEINLSGYQLILVNPGIHINTGWAFSKLSRLPQTNLVPVDSAGSLQAIISKPLSFWKDNLVNDFEKPVFESYPEIKAIKTMLYENGAIFASMSGSGSTVYGIFNAPKKSLNFPVNYLQRNILL